MKVRGQFLHSKAKTRGIVLGLVLKNSFILIIDLLFQCWTKLKVNIKIFISTPIRGTTKKALWRPIPSPSNPLQVPERNTKINFNPFSIEQKACNFWGSKGRRRYCEKSCQTYFLKKWSVSNFFKDFVVTLWNKIFLWRFWR